MDYRPYTRDDSPPATDVKDTCTSWINGVPHVTPPGRPQLVIGDINVAQSIQEVRPVPPVEELWGAGDAGIKDTSFKCQAEI
ncbi:hypothetical protein L198_01230 [Cryptococcus wingfieldii CBS 7118]|uniref:Uncharacterized protein n=1 Tax=Cryptococcus wingfieldii CBS 7118 TaxID=1295528 RepID=A0A1E3K3M7_9TREE|nr:hypothetical protein L198_01230 [Cryptococcus wingfieldii CBS 7118]ODO07649.1 hypothetical protein L198_01230 [Cryptococcus wingfieldii CBS 7118]